MRIKLFDQFKAISILAIVLFHIGVYKSGFLGVDVFFIISGYLLTVSILKEYKKTNGKLKLFDFYKGKFSRLWPALLLVILTVSIFSRIVIKSSLFDTVNGQALSASLFYQNWHNIFSEISYWGGNQDSPLTHLWFSSIIGQFYIVWPLIVIFALKFKKNCKNIVLNISIGLAILSGILQVILFNLEGFNRAYYGTDTRFIALMAGSILACLILDDDFKIKTLDNFKYKN